MDWRANSGEDVCRRVFWPSESVSTYLDGFSCAFILHPHPSINHNVAMDCEQLSMRYLFNILYAQEKILRRIGQYFQKQLTIICDIYSVTKAKGVIRLKRSMTLCTLGIQYWDLCIIGPSVERPTCYARPRFSWTKFCFSKKCTIIYAKLHLCALTVSLVVECCNWLVPGSIPAAG